MRISSSMYYNSLYATNNSKLSNNLFDVNKQIASGLKIEFAKDDVGVFAETMILDNELATLTQAKKSAQSGYKTSNQTDDILNEFVSSLDRVNMLLIQASNASSSESSMDAIFSELNGLKENLTSLANTSIGGKYLFSGSAIDRKPISDNGMYMGNNIALNSLLGSDVYQQYNLTGAELFLGEESSVNRKITTNVPQYDLSSKYPDFSKPENVKDARVITKDSTIRDLMGEVSSETPSTNPSHFYVNGIKSDGTSFSKHIQMGSGDKISNLLLQIGNAFGNTPSLDLVNVSLNRYGEIVIEDKMRGSSKLDFHMVGAKDYDGTDGNDAANIYDGIYNHGTDKRGRIDNLDDGETNFDFIINKTTTAANPNLFIKTFVQSPYEAVTTPSPELKSASYAITGSTSTTKYDITIDNGDGTTTLYHDKTLAVLKTDLEGTGDFSVEVGSNSDSIRLNTTAQGVARGVSIDTSLTSSDAGITISETIVNSVVAKNLDTMLYDRTRFSKDGATLSSSIPQVLKKTNAFADTSTKLSEVADLSKGSADTLAGTNFVMNGTDIFGTAYNLQIKLGATGSTFSLDGGTTNYDIFNMSSPRVAVKADDMTYRQLLDVMNMVLTNEIPAANDADSYDKAIDSANFKGGVNLTYDGKIEFKDAQASDTKASIALYDANAGNFASEASVLTFNSNDSLTIRDAKTDFFKSIDEMIKSVENYALYPDGSINNDRSIGMEDAIERVSDLHNHVARAHSSVGAQSNSLNRAIERTEILEVTTMSLRSSIIDTDLAEASLQLTQLSLNYEAMLSTVGKISKLSLVNYL